jgi:hypothetical protein
MKFLQNICEKTVFALFALCFSFMSLYVPVPQTVHAGAAGGGSSEVTQIANMIILGVQQGYQQISALANTVISTMTSNMWIKENILDGIGWALAKAIISQMTSSIINWVNSGFQGSPAFITDMEGFLLGIADRTFGQYLEELGGPFSFICAPFRLDVRVALSVYYESARASGAPSPSTCTLTGAMANIENFIDGTQSFTEAGGWNNWFTMTSQPTKYTPYGNLVEAQAQASARIVNARGEQVKLLDFGQGFLSSRICETVGGAGTSRERCTITTPGKVINEALTFQTSAGPRSLIEADEINEIISAVFAQLSQQAITGAAGLLGLTGGTGYSYTPVPYTTQLTNTGFTSDPARLRQLIVDARTVETNYLAQSQSYETRLNAYASNILNEPGARTEARNAASEIPFIISDTTLNIQTLNDLLAAFDARNVNDPVALQTIAGRFLDTPVHTASEVEGQLAFWENLLR